MRFYEEVGFFCKDGRGSVWDLCGWLLVVGVEDFGVEFYN